MKIRGTTSILILTNVIQDQVILNNIQEILAIGRIFWVMLWAYREIFFGSFQLRGLSCTTWNDNQKKDFVIVLKRTSLHQFCCCNL